MANPEAEANKEAPVADAAAKEKKAAEGKVAEGKAAEGKAADAKAPEAKAPEAKAPEAKAPENKAAEKKASEEKAQDEKKTEAAAAASATNNTETLAAGGAINVDELTQDGNLFDPNKMGILNDVSILLTIEVGRAQIKIRDLLNLTKGSIIELNKLAGDPVEIYANGKLISTGTIITANGKYCVRLISIPENNKMGAKQNGK